MREGFFLSFVFCELGFWSGLARRGVGKGRRGRARQKDRKRERDRERERERFQRRPCSAGGRRARAGGAATRRRRGRRGAGRAGDRAPRQEIRRRCRRIRAVGDAFGATRRARRRDTRSQRRSRGWGERKTERRRPALWILSTVCIFLLFFARASPAWGRAPAMGGQSGWILCPGSTRVITRARTGGALLRKGAAGERGWFRPPALHLSLLIALSLSCAQGNPRAARAAIGPSTHSSGRWR